MKKVITMSLFLFEVISLAGCNQQPVSQQKDQPVVTQQSATADETANWKTYTNQTFGYSIKYPATWSEKQSKVLEGGVSENNKNMTIEFYNDDTLMLRILADYKTKVGNPSLSSLASEVPPPMDKTTISGAMTYKIGSLDGYRRLVIVSDPSFQGLEYITKDSKYIYHMSTFQKAESTEIVKMLKTFTIK